MYPEPVNLTGIVPMIQYVNGVTNDIFVVLLLITVYIVPFIYLVMRKYNWIESALTSGFILTITTILLRVSSITTVDRYVFFGIASVAFPLLLAFLQDRSQ